MHIPIQIWTNEHVNANSDMVARYSVAWCLRGHWIENVFRAIAFGTALLLAVLARTSTCKHFCRENSKEHNRWDRGHFVERAFCYCPLSFDSSIPYIILLSINIAATSSTCIPYPLCRSLSLQKLHYSFSLVPFFSAQLHQHSNTATCLFLCGLIYFQPFPFVTLIYNQ